MYALAERAYMTNGCCLCCSLSGEFSEMESYFKLPFSNSLCRIPAGAHEGNGEKGEKGKRRNAFVIFFVFFD